MGLLSSHEVVISVGGGKTPNGANMSGYIIPKGPKYMLYLHPVFWEHRTCLVVH
jgi:hypothetical protein